MTDALDRLIAAVAPPDETDRIELEPGVSFWRSAGKVPAGGFAYDAALPAGLHFSAGRGEIQSRIGDDCIQFSGALLACFRLEGVTPCHTSMASGSRWRSIGLWVAPDCPTADSFDKPALPARPQPCVPCGDIAALIGSTAHQRYRGMARDYALRAQAYALLAGLTAQRTEPPLASADRRRLAARAAAAILDADYAAPPGLAELALRVGTNRRYLTFDFRALTGMTIAAYITRLRLEHASAMLTSGMMATQVAARIGLTPSHFAQAFRRRFGHLPSHHGRQLP